MPENIYFKIKKSKDSKQVTAYIDPMFFKLIQDIGMGNFSRGLNDVLNNHKKDITKSALSARGVK